MFTVSRSWGQNPTSLSVSGMVRDHTKGKGRNVIDRGVLRDVGK